MIVCDWSLRVVSSSRVRNRTRHRRRVVASACEDGSVNSVPWPACRPARATVLVAVGLVFCDGPEGVRQPSREQKTAPTLSTADSNKMVLRIAVFRYEKYFFGHHARPAINEQ
ncbi:unnamed protein product [Aphis gossypii]|uniref:Uncharacterized protein n=1 Tax=Aphis gossypii TaxID=80765 RepID=A0A9P0NTF7_APHGO|nr:unnamed protein product [Aphis gossypii]